MNVVDIFTGETPQIAGFLIVRPFVDRHPVGFQSRKILR